jgi:flavin reductase (DIM6/NTAB) family NADH-FMN oxidoreductase RutF/DNA-binding FadR family transcriptional regulator
MTTDTQSTVRYGADLGLPVVDEAAFRNVVGHFASGVTVVTTSDDDRLYGTTVSAVSSLSSEPPMMLVCLNRSSATHDAVARSGRYAINILSSSQGDLARAFARKGDDKFAGVTHSLSPLGLPLLSGTLAALECVVDETATGGTHTIFLGRVVSAEARTGEPLAYYRGTFGNLEHALETAAYEGTREWVLRRNTPLHHAIDVDAVATALRLEPALVNNALIRLATETGVIESYLEGASDEELIGVKRLGDQVLAMVPATAENLDAFLELNLDYHSAIVDLAGSRQLTSGYRALNVATVWRQTYQAEAWQRQMGAAFLPRITAAIENRDVAAAQTAVREQIEFVKAGAKEVIASRGGQV